MVWDYLREIRIATEVIDGDRLTLLQRLSFLQHLGAATAFLDFSLSPLVALWFACDAPHEKDGRVFIMDIGNPQIAVNGRGVDESEGLFRTDRIVYYEPDRSLGPRIVAQQSMFVICNPPRIPKPHVTWVDVPLNDKEGIRQHLSHRGVSDGFLFGDLVGWARANDRSKPLTLEDALTPEQHRDRGALWHRAERFEDALREYEAYAAALPDVAQPQGLLGDTLSAMGRFEEALGAYTRAIERIGHPLDTGLAAAPSSGSVAPVKLNVLYYNRGNVSATLGRHAEAVADFDSALRHGPDLQRNVLYNRGNSKYMLERFAEAYEDFDAAWSAGEGSDAALALGNCKVMMGEFPAAMSWYRAGVRLQRPEGSAAHCSANAISCRSLLDALDGREHVVRPQGQDVYVYVESQPGVTTFPFAGGRGNAGNTPSGMMRVPTGEGYEGVSGFAVIMLPTQT